MRNAELEEKELIRAKNSAYRLLTYRPRSKAELETKLHDKEFEDSVVRQVIADLIRLGYVNDLQFARQWAQSRVRLRGFGRRRIAQELKNKGVDREIIQQTFAELFDGDSEFETAKLTARKKLSTLRSVDPETRRRRLAGFLERKGFSFEIIGRVLRDTGKNA
jgi:regulatory protein